MQEAKGIVASASKDIERSVNVVKTALGAMGVGLSVGGLVAFTKNIISTTAALDDMAETTGTTVEELSKLQTVARIGGKDFAAVEDGLVKLTKGLRGTEEETKGARNALAQLGIQAKTATGQLRDPGELMREVAGKLAQFEDGAGKTAIALDLFGKNGAKLLPFLKDLAEEGSVAARVTAEQAAQAEKLEKAIARLQVAGEDARRSFVLRWTDDMVGLIEKFVAAEKATGNFVAALAMVAATDISGNLGERLKQIDLLIEQKTKSAKMLGLLGDEFGIAEKFMGTSAGALIQQREYLRFVQRQQALAGSGPANYDARDLRLYGPKPTLNYRGLQDKPHGKSLEDLLNEGAGVSKDFAQDLQTLHGAFESGRLTLEQYQEAVGKLIERQGFAKDLARQHTEEIKKKTEASKAEFEAEQKRGAQMIEFITGTGREIEQLEFENSLIGLSTAEREKAIAARKLENDFMAARKGLSDEEVESLRREKDAAKERLGVLIDSKVAREKADAAAKEAARAWEEEWKRASDVIERSLTDALMRGFEDGKGWAHNFKDALVNMFKTLVLRPIIQPIAQGAAGLVLGGLGIGTASAAGGWGGHGGIPGDVGGVGNYASLINSVYNMSSGGGLLSSFLYGSAMSSATSAAAVGGVATGAFDVAGMGVMGAADLAATGAGMAASALPWVGGALAIASIAGIGPFGKKKKKKKPADMYLSQDENGRYFIWGDDVPGPSARSDFAYLEDALNDPLQYDPAILATFAGRNFRGAVGERADSLLPKFLQYLAPAREAAAAHVASYNSQIAGMGALTSSLSGYVQSMTVSEYLSPEQRFAGAQTMYQKALEAAGMGDAVASQALPGLAQQLLGAGRTMYASGGQFQDLWTSVNNDLANVLQRQGEAQMAAMADIPAAILDANQATIDQFKLLRDELKEGLAALNRGLRQFGSAPVGAPA